MEVRDEEYQKEYDKAAAELEAAAQATTARDAAGKFTKAEPVKAEPEKKPEETPKPEPEKKEPEAKAPDELAELRARVEKAEIVSIVEKAHPGIFSSELEPELEKALLSRLGALDESLRQDPLVLIREITEEKLAHAERQVGKRFAAESAKLKEKTAMSVPGAGAGSGAKAPADAQLAEVDRIRNMSDADFQKEVRRVKGL